MPFRNELPVELMMSKAASVLFTVAFGAVYSPLGVMMGGLGGPALVSPETWGQLFLALELLLLHRTIALGRKGAALWLIPDDADEDAQ